MIITADHIRRFPFAAAPHRITDDLQSIIARDMADAARKEGHHSRLPPATLSLQARAVMMRAESDAAVFRAMMKGDRTVSQIITRVGMEKQTAQNALNRLMEDSRVIRTGPTQRGGGFTYAINPSYSPAQGVCDPAQPGNPTGRSSDVTTHAVVAVPLTGPGALNPLPANGGM